MILITGASGFVGRELIKHLDGDIRVLSRRPLDLKENVQVFVGNLLDGKLISEALEGVDTVVHLAATMNPNDKDIYRVNLEFTKLLVKKAKDKKFIFISSENVLSDKKDRYADSKQKAEEIVNKLDNAVILRPTAIYGKGDKRYIKKITNIIKKLPIIPLLGNGKFQPIYVGDLVQYIKESIKNSEIKGTYLLAGPSALSFKEFIQKIQKRLNYNKPIIVVPQILIKPFVYIYQFISKNPFITISQLYHLKKDRIYDSTDITSFKHKPIEIDEGLDKSIIFEI